MGRQVCFFITPHDLRCFLDTVLSDDIRTQGDGSFVLVNWNTRGRFVNEDGYLDTATGILSHNMYAYCNNNPVNMTDDLGNAGYHWAIGVGIVAGLAFATVLTAGSFAFAITAFGFAASGISVGGLTGGLAMATIGSAYALGASAMVAAFNSNSVSDFNSQGNWGTVGATTFGGITGFASGYSKPLQTKSIPNPEHKGTVLLCS